MTKKFFLQIKEEAKQDIVAASSWYKKQQQGLDKKFIQAIEETLERIINYPEAGTKTYKAFRQTNVKKFPYVIIYQVLFDSIIVFQVFNTWQHPKKRKKRSK